MHWNETITVQNALVIPVHYFYSGNPFEKLNSSSQNRWLKLWKNLYLNKIYSSTWVIPFLFWMGICVSFVWTEKITETNFETLKNRPTIALFRWIRRNAPLPKFKLKALRSGEVRTQYKARNIQEFLFKIHSVLTRQRRKKEPEFIYFFYCIRS